MKQRGNLGESSVRPSIEAHRKIMRIIVSYSGCRTVRRVRFESMMLNARSL